jgi:pimeloyl-ACP methyl ester carboxylesterase
MAYQIVKAFITLFISSLAATTSAQQETQTWYGVLDVGAAKLRLQMEFSEDSPGKFSGKMISLDQGSVAVPCDTVTINDTELTFTIKRVGAKFTGKLNATRDEAEGNFQQLGSTFPIKFAKVDKIPVQTHTQTWTGKMQAGGQEFDFQFRVFEEDKGSPTVKLDSFTEGLEGIPCTMKHEGDQITISVPIALAPAEFIGTLSDNKETVTGKWTQRGNSYDLVLKKIPLESTRDLKRKRPQTPQPPFDYDSEDVYIENKKDNLTLAGTLTSPPGHGPFPAVVMISGSGAQDRDETIFGHKLFFVIADHLAKHGIAVLRYDDRGTAKSTGNFADATSADFANDVEAVIDFLKTHQKVDPKRIILCGHSEGGIIAPMVASRRDDVAGVIMMAGPGVNGRQISVNQSKLIAEASGIPDYMIELNQTLLRGLYERQEKGEALDKAYLDELAAKMKQDLPEDVRDSFEPAELIETTVKTINSKWFAFFAEYDPVPALTKIRCPILAMVGEKDTQVDPKLNMPAIEKALKDSGNADFELQVLPNLNHLFQPCRTGAVAEYNLIEQTISPAALDLITQWLEQRFK